MSGLAPMKARAWAISSPPVRMLAVPQTRRGERAERRAVILEMAEQQVLGRFLAELPGGGRGHGAVVDGIEVARRWAAHRAAPATARRRGRGRRTFRRGRGGARRSRRDRRRGGGGGWRGLDRCRVRRRWRASRGRGRGRRRGRRLGLRAVSTTSPTVRRAPLPSPSPQGGCRPAFVAAIAPTAPASTLPAGEVGRGSGSTGPVHGAPRSAVSGSKPQLQVIGRGADQRGSPGVSPRGTRARATIRSRSSRPVGDWPKMWRPSRICASLRSQRKVSIFCSAFDLVRHQPDIAVEPGVAGEIEDAFLRAGEAAAVHAGGGVVLVQQRFEVLQRAVGFGAGERAARDDR